jgi:hypothetical protein
MNFFIHIADSQLVQFDAGRGVPASIRNPKGHVMEIEVENGVAEKLLTDAGVEQAVRLMDALGRPHLHLRKVLEQDACDQGLDGAARTIVC